MKKILVAVMLFSAVTARAADYVFVKTGGNDHSTIGTILNENGLAYDRNGILIPDIYAGNHISAVVNYSSVTFASVSISSDAWTFPGSVITKTAHGLQTGVAVLYTLTAGQTPNQLVDQTTYYAVRGSSADTFQLATSKVNAVAGTVITIGSATYSGTQTYTFAPIAYAGTPSFKWQGSNDGSNWFDLNAASVTMSSPNNATSAWDFEWYPFSLLRLNVTAPTTGGIKMKAYGYIRQ